MVAVVVGAVAVVIVVGAVADDDGAIADDVGRRVGSRGGFAADVLRICARRVWSWGRCLSRLKGILQKGGSIVLSAPPLPQKGSAPRGRSHLCAALGFRRAATARESNWRCRRESMGGGNESALPCEFDALRVREPANRESVAIYGSGLRFEVRGLPRQEQRRFARTRAKCKV